MTVLIFIDIKLWPRSNASPDLAIVIEWRSLSCLARRTHDEIILACWRGAAVIDVAVNILIELLNISWHAASDFMSGGDAHARAARPMMSATSATFFGVNET